MENLTPQSWFQSSRYEMFLVVGCRDLYIETRDVDGYDDATTFFLAPRHSLHF